jgi:ABC-type bacteriocin/lantibiotic exporters, contain an N-terminal double-glycine peptidase domain
VIDKVLVHQSSSTLWVLGVGILIALLFDSIFGYLRQLLMLAATNKIDMRLTRRTFAHLLSLPIDYFETTTAGVVTRHMQQLESIRHFFDRKTVLHRARHHWIIDFFADFVRVFSQAGRHHFSFYAADSRYYRGALAYFSESA